MRSVQRKEDITLATPLFKVLKYYNAGVLQRQKHNLVLS